ncbi:MAG: vitamin B12 dependent-methionine synthase activation domain-containing protein [Pseudomonadota bacterium]|uniref:AdoMet activation domain-containing protein n=1 Tax=Candidatus Desulfatibia profunda TaxID=2841695 RepID=A0A8J6TL79_9BACT|nr:hypothetical protein [Candidatus Desulfatibia profunda]MBL7178942.1 hypothetical protein [Desulfobacterales bacterium]
MEVMPVVEKNELTRLLGGGEFATLSRATGTKIQKLEQLFNDKITPCLHHTTVAIDLVENGSIFLKEGQRLTSPKLSKTMKSCKEMVCYIVTVGDGVERKVQQLMDENHLAEAYILDAMASVATENMVTTFHQQMMAGYEIEGRGVTLCFSPGYCDWPITDQRKLFGLFDSNQITVQLTDSCFMQPRKSISGVFGVTPFDFKQRSPQAYNPCLDCNKKNCFAKRN